MNVFVVPIGNGNAEDTVNLRFYTPYEASYIDGGNGPDNLSGALIVGGLQRDWLFGGQGDDVLSGGKGNDILTGDNGGDRFVFNPGDGRGGSVCRYSVSVPISGSPAG